MKKHAKPPHYTAYHRLLFFKNQRGFNLVEILVTMVISTIIMAGVVQIAASGSHTSNIANNLSSIQENARFSIDILSKEIRMANYMGCADTDMVKVSVAEKSIVASTPPFTDFRAESLRGYEVTANNSTTWASTSPQVLGTPILTPLQSTAQTNSDVISVIHASATTVALSDKMDNIASDISLTANTLGLVRNDLVMISSCVDANVFRVTQVTPGAPVKIAHATTSALNTTGNFTDAFQVTDHTWLHRIVYNTFYVRNNDAGIPSLYRYTFSNSNGVDKFTQEEMIQGVENMQILYGQRDDKGTEVNTDDRVRFTNASDNSLNWNEVDVIRIALLIRSDQEISTAVGAKTFDLLGTTVTVQPQANGNIDRRMRRIVTTTIKLRNKES